MTRSARSIPGIAAALAAACLGLAVATPSRLHAQAPDPKSIAARVELHPLASATLPDSAFLKGEESGRAVTVAGEFRIAQGQGRLPVVVLVHGSSGIGANIEPWTQLFNAMGVSTFVIDGFTGRGLVTVGTDQGQLGRLALIRDAYAALGVLAKHPRVDPERIVLMGFSRGGQAALYASLDRFHRLWNRSGIRFAAYVPFYPDCSTRYVDDTAVAAPIRLFHGTPDDYNPVAPCRSYLALLKEAGRDVALTEYPNAAHGFDSPLAPEVPVVATGSQTVRDCRIRETEPGLLVNVATDAPFTYRDACVALGPHVGGDRAATAAAREAVSAFVRQTFGLR